MEAQQKMRFREIIREHMDLIARDAIQDNTAVFDFALFQAKLPDAHREVVVDAEEILLSNSLDRNDNDFDGTFLRHPCIRGKSHSLKKG